MDLKQSVSIIAVMVAAFGSTVAQAQTATVTPADANVLNLLSPFLGLNATAIGRQTLRDNLQQSIAINNAATPQQQQLAISDKSGNVINGLGPILGGIYASSRARDSTASNGSIGRVNDLMSRSLVLTASAVSTTKNYFANGAAINPGTVTANYVPVRAVAAAGYSLPTFGDLPNARESVYDLAYGVSNRQPGQNVYGNSRPLQVSSQINQFDPTAINGVVVSPAFPSGHTAGAYNDSILFGMLVPELYQSMLLRAGEFSKSRAVLGVHYPLDLVAGRALTFYGLAQAFTNPLYIDNAATTGTALNLPSQLTAAQTQLRSTFAQQCGDTVAACAASAANTANNPFVPSAANQAAYRQGLTSGLPTLTFAQAPREAAPAGGPDPSILLATLYGGSTAAARTIAPNGGLHGQLATDTINQIVVNTQTNALAAFYGTALSYWSRIDLYSAAGYFGNVTGTLRMDNADRLTTNAAIGSGGALYANGTITGLATVGAGGLLGGIGTVGGVSALSGGTVAPGNSIGTLRVAGNVAFAAGSTYQVEANATGQSDRIAASGAAALNGGTVQVLAAGGTYDPRTRYTILTAGSGVSGQFAGVTANLAFLSPSLRYQANEVDLTLTRNDIPFATIAQTRNQAAVATAIQAGGAGTGAYDRTIGLTTPEAVGAFQALTGDIHASAIAAEFETAFFVRESILGRMRWGASPGDTDGADYGRLPASYTADLPGRRAAPVPVPVRVLDPRVFGVWGQGFGSFGQARTDGNAASLSRQTSGFVLGADARVESGFRFGLAGGYTVTNLDTGNRLQSGAIESGFGGLYGGYERGPVSLRLGAVYADNSARLRRTVLFAGVSDAPTARTGGATIQGFGELGYKVFLGGAAAPNGRESGPVPVTAPSYIEPFVGGAAISIRRDRFAETGGVAALTGFARDYDLGTATAGLRAQTSLELGFGVPVSAHGLLGYRRAFGDVVPTALLAFGATGPTFLTAGLPIDRDALVAEAGLDLRVSANATLGVAYAGQAGRRAEDHAVKGNFTYRF
ncbi:autotransporter domain-containing protein [Methylobacterium sp. J-090]|uniref:autotransporter family protein n=1 Tax=Methylobacterium sp. J-090 TaxID=2836666 RepID=UPI001FBC0721|nr:autotransporter domain-containing protein [Methylobacterium sp. J-090]MCJ2081291.1 autotransporter domain-containing protein [Methylobacterium sp. J-090]